MRGFAARHAPQGRAIRVIRIPYIGVNLFRAAEGWR